MRLDISFLVGVWLEAVVYGIYLAAFGVCLRLFRTRTPSVGRALPIWLVALFILATAHCALSLSATLDVFVRQMIPLPGNLPPPPSPSHTSRPGQPIPSPIPTFMPTPGPPRPNPVTYISNRALPTNLASLGVYAGIILVSDLMMLYRLLVAFRYKFLWTIIPGLLSLASFVISMIVVSKYSKIDLSLSSELVEKQLATVDPWVPPVYAISFLASLAITALMMIRTSFASSSLKPTLPAFVRRGRRHARSTSLTAGDDFVFDIDERTGPPPPVSVPAPSSERPAVSSRWVILAGLIESGALAPVFMLAALILYVAQDGQETLLVPLLAPLAALVPTLQIVQIQLGLDSASRTAPSRTSAAAPGPGGRSPYLVPGPQYRDDSSSDEEQEDAEDKLDLLDRAMAKQGTAKRPDPGARRWSARWAWRGSGSGSGHGRGSGSGSGSGSRSQSSSSNGRPDPVVALPMQDLSSRPTKDSAAWERIKQDESTGPPPRRHTLRKSSGPVIKEMISKPVPVASDFPPPSTANIPSTPLPSFVISSAQGATAAKASLARAPSGGLGRAPSGKEDGSANGEHKYHYRMRPREKTAQSLAAYLSAQAEEALSRSGQGSAQNLKVGSLNDPGSGHPNNPPPPAGHSVSGHTEPASLLSTVPTSPASGFTSLAPHSTNPFRFDAATPPPLAQAPSSQHQHQRSYSDIRRGDAPSPANMTGVGLSGSSRTPLTFPFAPPNAAEETVPRWAALPGAPFIPGLGGGYGRQQERDVSPAPGLQQDYARAREEVLRQMQRERERMNGAISDDESVYSTQPQPMMRGSGWRAFPNGER